MLSLNWSHGQGRLYGSTLLDLLPELVSVVPVHLLGHWRAWLEVSSSLVGLLFEYVSVLILVLNIHEFLLLWILVPSLTEVLRRCSQDFSPALTSGLAGLADA